MMSLASFGLDDELLHELGEETSLPPAEASSVIAAIAAGQDTTVLLPAGAERLRTWALPLLQRARQGALAAVLVPDEETAQEVLEVLGPLAARLGIPTAAVLGDEDQAPAGGIPVVAAAAWEGGGKGLGAVVVEGTERMRFGLRERLGAALKRLVPAQLVLAGSEAETLAGLLAAAGRHKPPGRARASRSRDAAATEARAERDSAAEPSAAPGAPVLEAPGEPAAEAQPQPAAAPRRERASRAQAAAARAAAEEREGAEAAPSATAEPGLTPSAADELPVEAAPAGDSAAEPDADAPPAAEEPIEVPATRAARPAAPTAIATPPPPAPTPPTAAPPAALYPLEDDLKHALLLHLLVHEVPGRAMVFARTRYRADRLAEYLNRNGIPTDRVHGNRSPGQRNEILGRFRDGRLRVVVATDGVLRGGELPDAAWRISFDVAEGVDAYQQRLNGAESTPIVFASPEESSQLAGLERSVGSFARRELPELDEADEPIFAGPGERPPQRVMPEERQPHSFASAPHGHHGQGHGGQGGQGGGGKRKRGRSRGAGGGGGGGPKIADGNRASGGGGRGNKAQSGKRHEDVSRWDIEQPVFPEGSPYDLPQRRPGDRSRPSHVPAAFRTRGGG
jgi:hypothetical protein